MRKLATTLAVALITLGLHAQEVDLSKSSIHWKGEKVTGFHEGNIGLKSARFVEKNGAITQGTFEVDMNSITCTDLDDAEYNGKLVGHLKSDDFFGTATHPVATLKITKSATFKDGKAKVSGDLTIKGTTQPAEFEVVKSGKTYTAKLIVDRTKYDVKYGSSSFFDDLGDKVIYDNFELNITLTVK